MKNIFNLLFVMLIAMNFHSCDDWTEMETKNFEPEPLSEEYYAALREYKKVITPHIRMVRKLVTARGSLVILQSEKYSGQCRYRFYLGIIRQSDAIPERRPEICSGSVGNTCYIHPILTQHGQSSR